MTRYEVKQLFMTMELHNVAMKAYIQGKELQYFDKEANKWIDIDEPSFNMSITYRIQGEEGIK